MSNCHVSNQIAEYCNDDCVTCSECRADMTEEYVNGSAVLECDECGHKVWADGDEFEE